MALSERSLRDLRKIADLDAKTEAAISSSGRPSDVFAACAYTLTAATPPPAPPPRDANTSPEAPFPRGGAAGSTSKDAQDTSGTSNA